VVVNNKLEHSAKPTLLFFDAKKPKSSCEDF